MIKAFWIQQFLTCAVTKLAKCRVSSIKNWVIRQFIRHYKINMNEVVDQNLDAYPHFNAFFTRALKPGVRPLPEKPECIVSPADGVLAQFGSIQTQQMLQAKNFYYSVEELLADDPTPFINGNYATIYLAPKDYHRVHMPATGRLVKMRYMPGSLFPVKTESVNTVPQLFTRNERVICWFETDFGPMALVLVGALIVGSIETVWAGQVTPPHGGPSHYSFYKKENITLARGEEMGRFQFGSTVIALFPKKATAFANHLSIGQSINMGQGLAYAKAMVKM